MFDYLFSQIAQQHPKVIGIAEANEAQEPGDFVGDCFFVSVNSNRYRLDTTEALSPTEQSEIQSFADSVGLPPDWDGFMDSLSDAMLGAIAQSPMASMIVSRLTRLVDGDASWSGTEDRLISVWNAAPPALDEQQRDELTALADAASIPISIDSGNLISAQ